MKPGERQPSIFISYRRSPGTDAVTGAMVARLRKEFPSTRVFRDADALEPGRRFDVDLEREITHATVVLAVIDRKWAPERLQEPGDFVRHELEQASLRHIPVVPLLVAGATLPHAEALPDALRDWLKPPAQVVRADAGFDADMRALAERLRYHAPALAVRRPRRAAAFVALGAVLAVGLFLVSMTQTTAITRKLMIAQEAGSVPLVARSTAVRELSAAIVAVLAASANEAEALRPGSQPVRPTDVGSGAARSKSAGPDCRRSSRCSERGACTSNGSDCIATDTADCRASVNCKRSGACTARSGACVAASDDDCRASGDCTRRALCSVVGTRCGIRSDEDCVRSELCKQYGACTFFGNVCATQQEIVAFMASRKDVGAKMR